MKKQKNYLGMLLIIAIVISLLPYKRTEAAAKKYLVISYDDGNYWGYDDMVERTSNGALMIPAKKFADNFGLDYENLGKGKFTLTDTETESICTYQRGTKKYSLVTKKKQNKTAKYAPILSNKTNMIHCNAVSPLFYCKYFSAPKATEYKAKGYSGVLLYSKYPLSDSDLPPISYIENAEELGLIEKEDIKDSSENDIDDKKEPTLGEIIDSNLDTLKKYTKTYGIVYEGERVIQHSRYDVLQSGEICELNATISYNEKTDELSFFFLNDMSGVLSSVEFIINPQNTLDQTNVQCALFNEEYEFGFVANAQMIVPMYNKENLVFVASNNIGLADTQINQFSNLSLQLAINFLDLMLMEKLNLRAVDIGFTLYGRDLK